MKVAAISLVSLLVGCAVAEVRGQAPASLPSIEVHTRALRAIEGFVPAWWDEKRGRLLIEAPAEGVELLYLVSLPAGLGSNSVGLDRGQLGDGRLVEFRRVGRRVLLVQPNLKWRASDDSDSARRAVRDSFAESVLWGFDAVAEEGGRVLVDATDFLLRDAHRVARRLESTGQGSFELDASRSAVWLESTRGFPDNTELEVLLTFTSEAPGPEVAVTAADPRAVSLRVRHSFVRLPPVVDASAGAESGYRTRAYDPRCGFYPESWKDVAAPIDDPLLQQVIVRHRLTASRPIVYHVDHAAPEPVRTALLEGARYWTPVFAAAGFPGGFRVEVLPEDADPQDVRYNVIQWVQRSTRGWSYGRTVVDPRTGEVLKGHVTLGALRVRQDVLLGEGLLSPYDRGVESDPRVTGMALARIRQLSAHEVGHTLGLRHNFAASISGRASVMDYPAPRVRITDDGELDLSDAYREGAGEWDALAIRYGYTAFEREDEAAGLRTILDEMKKSGIAFLTDSDARGNGRAHPLANLWDDGADPIEGLRHEIEVRRIALERFSPAAIELGEPLSSLEDALVPLYFHHRYQLEAAVRQVGGVWYEHAVRDGLAPPQVRAVDAETQRRAFETVLETLQPGFLALPGNVLRWIPPPAPGGDPAAERFDRNDLLLDPQGIQAAGIHMTLQLLLDTERATRLVDQKLRDPEQLGLGDVFQGLMIPAITDEEHVRGELRAQVLEHVMRLATEDAAPVRVQRMALFGIHEVKGMLDETPRETLDEMRQALWELDRIRHFLEDPVKERAIVRRHPVPPGSPIGCGFREP
ncbi:MAG: zinc-dependent metalloprotease [Planctomycetota bacterium]|nr:zinc-dependent metalloprotease [Planctomycetota bacterium]